MLTKIVSFGTTIPAYSFAVTAGIIATVFYTKIRVRKDCFVDLDKYLELEIVYSLAGTAIGSKLLYLMIEYRHLIKDMGTYGLFKTVRAYLAGGFVFYGGVIGCVLAIYLFCISSKISFSHSLQLILPAIPLAHSFGRIGCFVTGCCFGIETHNCLHVIYNHSQFAPNGVPLVPIQLIEAVFELILFLVLNRDSNNKLSGTHMLCKYAMFYGVGRFVLEFFRGDERRGHIGLLSVSQVISLIIIATGILYMLHVGKMNASKK